MNINEVDSERDFEPADIKQNLNEARNTIVRSQLTPVLLGLGILYLLITIYYYFSLTGRVRLMICWIATVTTLVFFIMAYYTRKRVLPLRSVHSLALSLAVLLLVDATIYLALTGNIVLTDLFIYLIIGVGFFLLSTRMVFIFILLSIACWLIVAWKNLDTLIWIQHAFSLMIACATSILIHIIRLRTIERAERLRLQNEFHYKKLVQTLADLRNQENLYQDLFENANDLIQSVDTEGRFIYVNRRWKEVLGYRDDELKDLRLKQVLAPEQVDKCEQAFQSVQKGATYQNLETVFIAKDGRRIILEGNINGQFQDDRFIASRAIFRDITIRRQALQEVEKMRDVLKELNRQLAAAYEESRRQKDELLGQLHDEQSALLLAADGEVLGVTERVIRLTGFSRLELIGKNIKDLVEPNSRLQMDNVLKVVNIGGFKSIDTEFIQPQNGYKKFGLGLNRINLDKKKLFIAVIWEK